MPKDETIVQGLRSENNKKKWNWYW